MWTDGRKPSTVTLRVNGADEFFSTAANDGDQSLTVNGTPSEFDDENTEREFENGTSINFNITGEVYKVVLVPSEPEITTYQVVFHPSDTVNYNTVETAVTLTVNKATNAPNMPGTTMNVANSCAKVSDVTLPTGWVWQDEDKDTALTVGTPVTATAVYDGKDKGNYVNETVSVSITRSECDHIHTEIRGAVAATCTAGGYTGDTYCIDCGTKTKTGTVTSALGHNYTSKVTTEPTTEKEGVRTYTCDRCGHSYTRPIDKLQDTNNKSTEDNQPGEEKAPDTGKPYIKDENGKEGWEVVLLHIFRRISAGTKTPAIFYKNLF